MSYVGVWDLDEDLSTGSFGKIGFRLRPEPWNPAEPTPAAGTPELTFVPLQGERPSNVHVMEAASEAIRRELLSGIPAAERHGPRCLGQLKSIAGTELAESPRAQRGSETTRQPGSAAHRCRYRPVSRAAGT